MGRRRREAEYVCEGCDSRVFDAPSQEPPGWTRVWIADALRLLCGCCGSEVLYGTDRRVPRWASDRMRQRFVEWSKERLIEPDPVAGS